MKVIIFAQLGSPDSPAITDVRIYLKKFLSNRLVVDINPFWWKLILNFFILPVRSKKSAARYQHIWDGKKFLLSKHTENFTHKMQHHGLICDFAYLFGTPSLQEIFKKYEGEEVEVWPLFPQYCKSTTGLIEEASCGQKIVRSFHDRDFYIENCVRKIREGIEGIDSLIISFHSVPIKDNVEYIQQCLETFQLICRHLDSGKILLAFQSKFGIGEWMGPSLEDLVKQEAEQGRLKIAIFCPGFLMDCLETQVEVGVELKQKAKTWGADLRYISCLNDSDSWCEAFLKEVGN